MGILSGVLHDDRVLFVGLGVITVGALTLMHSVLGQLRDDVEIKPVPPKTQYITQETEDALRLNTLDTLASHYNFAIRETAIKIICDRAANDGHTIEILLFGITRPDWDERMKNLRALALITDHQSLPFLHTDKAYSALVRSLTLSLTDTPPQSDQDFNDDYFDSYHLRDMAEKLCLMFITQLLNKYDADKLIKASFVENWLSKQPWGSTDPEREINFGRYMFRRKNRITDICHRLERLPLGVAALERAGLLPKGAGAPSRSRRFSFFMSSDSPGGLDPDAALAAPRVLEQSLEEQRLRRQHREAMVLNDGTQPLSRGDIIERDHDTPD